MRENIEHSQETGTSVQYTITYSYNPYKELFQAIILLAIIIIIRSNHKK